MMKKVKNSAKLMRTAFGGVCCAPIAVRNSESTMTILTNDVTMTNSEGASVITVINTMI